MIVSSIYDLNLHDSELLEIVINRVDRTSDRVELRLNYIDDYKLMRTSERRLIFSGCVKTVFDINYKVATPDSIMTGDEISPSTLLEVAREKGRRSGMVVGDTVKHFRIVTNTTGSVIDILSDRIEMDLA